MITKAESIRVEEDYSMVKLENICYAEVKKWSNENSAKVEYTPNAVLRFTNSDHAMIFFLAFS